jgi:serine/threonine protein kinase
MNEISILRNFKSAHVINLLEVFRDDERIYLATDFCAGGELFSLVEHRGALTEIEAKNITRQLVTAVADMHRNGICHRDLKLENVLLESKTGLDVKIIDFGLSRCNGTDKLKTRIGTPYYVAPEVILA